MRKIFLSLLLASAVATPALADPGDQNDRQAARQERQQARAQRQQQRSEQRQQYNGGGNYRAQMQQQNVQAQQVQNVEARNWRGRFNQQQNYAQQQQVQQQYNYRNAYRGGFNGQQVEQRPNRTWSGQGYATQQYRNSNRYASGGWDRNWRNNDRYDWRRYRDNHRSTFRIGAYYDPFGYGYQSFGIGYQLMPAYFGQRYWIDPQMYDLPFPPPGAQWIRYWNDAVLVDMYSGQVIDVINGFFW